MPLPIRSLVAFVALTIPLSAQVGVSISPMQNSYAVGEPIDFLVTIDNTSDGFATFTPAPRLDSSSGGLQFKVKGQKPIEIPPLVALAWSVPPTEPIPDPPSFYLYRQRSPGAGSKERRSTKLLLQEFYGNLPPGRHHIEYSIEVRLLRPGSEPPVIDRHGAFDLVIYLASGAELDAALARHLAVPDSSDYWEQGAYRDGLCMITQPVVIPYLTKLPGLLGSAGPVKAMAKFKGNDDAQRFVLSKLGSDDPSEVAAAIYVLQVWKHVLPEPEVARLLNTGKTESRLAAMRYVYNLPGGAFLPEVRALGGDPDPTIAAASRLRPLSEGAK